jgi:polysaccharide export outer membrane protein
MKYNSLILFLTFLVWFGSMGVHADPSYRLGVSDVVRVTVYGQPDLSTVSRVSENGSVTLPTVGQVTVSGLTAGEAELKLAKILTEMEVVKDAQVGIVVEQYLSKKVTVLGEVARPGVYAITRGTTVTDMISEAGGLSADAGDVAIVTRKRASRDQQVVVDLPALLKGRSNVPEPRVSDGDRIFVPKADVFYVYGEVNRPGAYPLERGMTVLQAISVAGGLTDKGTERGLKIRRKKSDGGEEVIPAHMTQPVQPNDVLQIKESLF